MIYINPSQSVVAQPLLKRLPASDRAYPKIPCTVGGANGTTMVAMFVG